MSFKDAAFGQQGEEFAVLGGGADMWGGTNQFGSIYRPQALGDGAAVTPVWSRRIAPAGGRAPGWWCATR